MHMATTGDATADPGAGDFTQMRRDASALRVFLAFKEAIAACA